MNKLCKTCGGELEFVRKNGDVSEYRCTCCDNIYFIRKGEEFTSGAGSRPHATAFGATADLNKFAHPYKPAQPVNIGQPAKPAQPTITAQPYRPAQNTTTAQQRPTAYVPESAKAQPTNTQPTARAVLDPSENVGRLDGAGVYAACIDSVIEVRAYRGKSLFSGSAYSLGGGYAVTNAHVVAEGGRPCDRLELYACGKRFGGSIAALGTSGMGEDLALLKLSDSPAQLKAVKFADVSQLKNGQTLYVIGNSLGGGTCITSGIVSDKRRLLEGKQRLMTDCAVNRGNSGGPVFNDRAEVVGTIVAVTTTAEGMNYAIPADIVKKFLALNGIKI